MQRTIEFAGKIETTIFDLLPTGLNYEGSEIDKMANAVKAAGAGGLLRSELT
jgi:hypothetical protein